MWFDKNCVCVGTELRSIWYNEVCMCIILQTEKKWKFWIDEVYRNIEIVLQSSYIENSFVTLTNWMQSIYL